MSPCNNKKRYDTEFEATVRAAKSGYQYGEEMEVYQHGNHWHVTHTEPDLRGKHVKKMGFCRVCKVQVWEHNMQKHERMPRHKQKAKEKAPE